MKMFKKVLIILGAVVVGFIMLGMIGSAHSPSPSPSTMDEPAPVGAAPDPSTSTPYGESWETDGLTLKAGEAIPTQTFGMNGFCVPVTYLNTSTETQPFNLFDWKLTNTDGVVLSPTFTGGNPDKALGSGDLNPGGKRAGEVCFEDKGTATPKVITYARTFGPSHDWQ